MTGCAGWGWIGTKARKKAARFGPYFQSQRADIYQRRIQELKDKGLAYEREGAIRFKMTRQPIEVPDLIAGGVVRPLNETEMLDPDFVIVRSDGNPVFHLVNVVDDIEMKITHVIRGEDHLSNTPKHIALFRAFGVEPPKYAHIPMILNPDGTKMSKSDPDPAKARLASLQTYVEDGYVPEAVRNYLCLLGWSPKDNREIMPIDDIVKLFDLPQILRNNARFDVHQVDVDERRISPRDVARPLHRTGAIRLPDGHDDPKVLRASVKGKGQAAEGVARLDHLFFHRRLSVRSRGGEEIVQRAADQRAACETRRKFCRDSVRGTPPAWKRR